MKRNRLAAGAVSVALAITLTIPVLAASTSFTDVPADHWAVTAITEMADRGVMQGIGNNLFAPSQTITNAQFITMVSRCFYEDKIGEKGDDAWYAPYLTVAQAVGFLEGTSVGSDTSLISSSINRYDMAQIMYNVMKNLKMTTSSLSDTSKVADWDAIPTNYRDAVSVCYNMGMLTGTDAKGTFNGTGIMNRAQAAVVLDRLVEGQTAEVPATPSIPAGALELTGSNTTLRGNGSEYKDGIFYLVNTDFWGTGGYIKFTNNGYNTLTFTVAAHNNEHRVTVWGVDSVSGEQRLNDIQAADTTKAYTVDITGIKNGNILVSYGVFCDVTVTGVYLSK